MKKLVLIFLLAFAFIFGFAGVCENTFNNTDNDNPNKANLATFEQIDTDGDGVISDEEYAHWIASQQ